MTYSAGIMNFCTCKLQSYPPSLHLITGIITCRGHETYSFAILYVRSLPKTVRMIRRVKIGCHILTWTEQNGTNKGSQGLGLSFLWCQL